MTPAQDSRTLTVCVVSHTHWDREWYHSAPRFRQQLVALVDSLIENATGATAPFLLDGQAIVLEDYLAVRPERASQLKDMLESGALEAGPWYVLADGLIPSGEAIVRNLLIGRQLLRLIAPRSVAPPVAYCPDTFGHPSAIPLIANGFGFTLAIVWRGYGSTRHPSGDTARWASEDGSEVLLYHLPPDGYETGSALPAEDERAQERWKQLKLSLGDRSSTGVVLLPNGADHHALQPDIAAALSALQRVARPDVVLRESLSGFAERLNTVAAQRNLPRVSGELRDSYGYTWTLGGTYGTRAYQKRDNARAERDLLRDVEPWLVLAWLHGEHNLAHAAANSRITLAQAPSLLSAAWRTLLRAHPHDTLCGCSIDAVARALDEHLASARAQARGLRMAALNIALHHDPVAARGRPVHSEPMLIVRNRTPRWGRGVVEVLLDETVADAPVGPSSADVHDGIEQRVDEARTNGFDSGKIPVVGGLKLQQLKSRLVFRRRESPQHYPDNDVVREHRALVWMESVSPLGTAVEPIAFVQAEALDVFRAEHFRVPGATSFSSPGSKGDPSSRPAAAGTASAGAEFQAARGEEVSSGVELSNGLLQALVSVDGLRLIVNGRSIENVLTFDTSRDVGDSYTPAVRGKPERLRIVRVQLDLRGPLRSSAKVWLRTEGKKRNGVRIVATLSLDAGADTLRVDICGFNERRDHRLRVNFNTDVNAHADGQSNADVWADAAFGPVLRPLLNVPLTEQHREMVPPTMPMHRWVTITNGTIGATLHSDGLAEAEADRDTGTIALTLVRAIGELSRNDLPERPGHAGWPAKIPQAQSLGPFRAKIALQLHGAWTQTTRDVIEAASDAMLLPLVGFTMRDYERAKYNAYGPQLRGTALRFSAASLADDGDGIILRCVNDSNESRNGSWELPNIDALEFAAVRLDETRTGDWQPVGKLIEFIAPPRAVVTIRVRRRAQ